MDQCNLEQKCEDKKHKKYIDDSTLTSTTEVTTSGHLSQHKIDKVSDSNKLFFDNFPLAASANNEMYLKNIKQYKVQVYEDCNKKFTILDMFSQLIITRAIIFVNTVEIADELKNILMDNNYQVGVIHNEMNKDDSEEVLTKFKLSRIKYLILTDGIFGNIDVHDLNIVINYDMASDLETYIHRIKKSGIYNSHGIAISFETHFDDYKFSNLKKCNITLPALPVLEEINQYLSKTVMTDQL